MGLWRKSQPQNKIGGIDVKCALKSILISIILMCMTVTASAARFTPPFNEHILGDKIAENMPAPFSVSNVKCELIASTDFNTYDKLTNSWTYGDWQIEDNTLIAVKEDKSTLMQKSFSYKGEIEAGEYYAFTCKMKEENVTAGALPRTILFAYSNNSWVRENGTRLIKGETDANGYFELTQVLEVPDGTNELRLAAQLDVGSTGTVKYKDFKLYKIALDPLDVVLLKPAYKGLIYGDAVADIDVSIKITERKGTYTYDNMELLVTLSDSADNVIYSSKSEKLNNLMNVTFSSKGLSEGTYYISAKLTDKASGEVISRKMRTIRKVGENEKPLFYVDNDGHAVRNNEKTFFKRIYNAQNDYAKIANDIKNTAVDTIAHNGMGWWFSNTNENMAEAFSILDETGKKIHLSLMGYWWGNRELDVNMFKSLVTEQKDIRAFFKKITDEHKNFELLDGYYLFDEPNPVLYGEEIWWNNEILADFDINHPTYGIADGAFDNYGIFTKMVDVLGIDPYPIGGKETDDIAQIGRSIREITTNFPNRPVYLCLQGFNYTGKFGLDSRGPNYTELRNMAYQAIAEGADGLDCYAYQAMQNDPSGKTFDEWWSELTTLYDDVEKYEKIILSSEPAPKFTALGGGEWLNITSRRYNGKSYIFAVNNTKNSQSLNLKMERASNAKSDNGENFTYGENGFELSFSPLEVKILEIDQMGYQSPEAELISMGFFNCRKVFPVEKGEENILQVNEDYIIINYHAQISDKAKLYINGVEKPLTGKISIRHADSFTVCVVAEDGITKTTAKYVIDKCSN